MQNSNYMNKKLGILLASATLLALPAIMLAQNFNAGVAPVANPGSPAGQLNVNSVIDVVLRLIWPFFVGFAVIMFILAGFVFLTAQGDPAKVGTARMAVLWGIVGVAMGILAFALPFIVRNTLNIG